MYVFFEENTWQNTVHESDLQNLSEMFGKFERAYTNFYNSKGLTYFMDRSELSAEALSKLESILEVYRQQFIKDFFVDGKNIRFRVVDCPYSKDISISFSWRKISDKYL